MCTFHSSDVTVARPDEDWFSTGVQFMSRQMLRGKMSLYSATNVTVASKP